MDNNLHTVWIVDDDSTYRYAFRKFVEMKRFCRHVVDFDNGQDAIDFLTNPINIRNLPDLIFLDIDMPIMDGWAFIETFESNQSCFGKSIPIFMVTSSISYADIVNAKRHPIITDYILKPVDSQQFSALFSDYLERQKSNVL
jgi:CheY-like chemotaxis protein